MNELDRAGFKAKQFEFTAHIRNPQLNAKPAEIEDRRMGIYRELFFNNVVGFLDSTFPVLKSTMDEKHWMSIARDFFANHRCHSPLFVDISKAFVEYLQEEREPHELDPPFMLELAHYEWVELAIEILDEEADYSKIDPNGDMLQGIPVMSPLAWSLAYEYPVHEISDDHQPQAAPDQPTFIVVYRDRTFEVQFTIINPVSARLLELISENTDKQLSGYELLIEIARELGHPDPELIVKHGATILEQLHADGILLGTVKA